jgi:hypothetical protein
VKASTLAFNWRREGAIDDAQGGKAVVLEVEGEGLEDERGASRESRAMARLALATSARESRPGGLGAAARTGPRSCPLEITLRSQ